MAPGPCTLSDGDLRAQLDRYRAIGSGGEGRWINATSVELVVGAGVPDGLVEQTVATEQSCCPFFELLWEPGSRRLAVSVSRAEDVSALDVIARALNI
jgi:hypothetical protein